MALAVLIFCVLSNLLARGISETYAVFLLPLGRDFGWGRAELTSVYSIFMLAHGLAAPFAGLLFDRIGPRFSYVFGLLCYGCGYTLTAYLNQLWQFYLCIGVLGGIGVAAIGMVPASALVSRWFRDRLTTAMGVAYGGLGCGVLIIVPLIQWLLEHQGWRWTYSALGLILLALVPLFMLLPWSKMAAGHPEYMAERKHRVLADGDWTLYRATGSSAFWALVAVFFFTAVAVYAVSVQSVAYLIEVGFSPLQAATAFGLTGMLSIAGMVGTSWLADRFGRRRIVSLSYLCTISGIACLYLLTYQPNVGLLIAFVVLFGIVQGSRGPVVSSLVAKLFAGGGIGAIYGATTLGMGVGAAVGSWAAGWLHDLTGGYAAGFGLGALAALSGLALFWIVPALASAEVPFSVIAERARPHD